MPGWSDYTNQNIGNYMAGSLAMPSLPAVFLALFTTAPTADAGTGAVEPSTNGYARQQIAGAVTTNATTAAGNATLHFASVPSWILGPSGTGVVGMQIRDATSASVIPANTTLVSATATTVVMSNNAAGAGVGGTDSITFSAFGPATASGSSQASTTPGGITNSNAVVTFAQATGTGWGTIVAGGFFDALTTGNLLSWDWLGLFKWLPFSCTSASPGVITAPAHGYSNGDSVVFSIKYGGTLPTTAGSFNGIQTVAGAATDTFNVGINTTSTGNASVRKITQQPVAGNVTVSFSSNQLTISDA